MLNPFTPGPTVTLAVTEDSAPVALPVGLSGQIMVTSAPNSSLAFIQFGDSTVVATEAASTPVLPTAAYIFTIGPDVTHAAGITATGDTATLYFTPGQGQ
jgi:hypothetical protein